MKDFALGQYLPGKSLLHRLDPRVKFLSSVLFLVAAFSAKSLWSFGVLIAFCVFLTVCGGIPVRILFSSLKPLIIVLLLTSVFVLFSTRGIGDPYFSISVFSLFRLSMYPEGIVHAILFAVRIIILVLSAALFLTYTTTPTTLTDAMESVFRPLTKFHVPVYDFAMMMTIALRFIPTLAEETEKIMSAQKARGADFSGGSLRSRIRALIPIIIPLFASSFRRAVELATAMECRCYRGGESRTKLNAFHLVPRDVFFFAGTVLMTAAVFVMNALLPTSVGL